MGNERLKRVKSQNEEFHILGGVCRQGQFEKQYKELLPEYSAQIRGLMGRLESGIIYTKEKSRPLTKRQRARRENRLLHLLELREEVLIFTVASESSAI